MLDPRVWGTNLIFGYRLDTHNVYGTAHSWRGGLVAPLPRDVYLKVLVGRAFQAPSAELLYAQQLGDRDVVGNPDLIPETIDTVEALVSWAPWPGLELSLDAYFNQIRNKVELVLEANRSQARNLAEIRTLGYEGEVRWSSGKTSAFANAAFQTTVRQATEEEDEVLGGHNVLFPEVIANAGATYRFLDGLTAAGEMNAIGTRKASPSNSLEADEPYDLNPYLLWSLSLRYDARGTWMAARALNLLDASFVEPGFNGVDLPGRGRRIVAEIGGDL